MKKVPICAACVCLAIVLIAVVLLGWWLFPLTSEAPQHLSYTHSLRQSNAVFLISLTNAVPALRSGLRYDLRPVEGSYAELQRQYQQKQHLSSNRTARRITSTHDPTNIASTRVHYPRYNFDIAVLCNLDGKLVKHEDALPTIKEYLWSEDKAKILVALRALKFFGPKLASTDTIDRMLLLYDQTESTWKTSDLTVTRDEGLNLDIKLEILFTMANGGDVRVSSLLDKAEKDRNSIIRDVARSIKGRRQGVKEPE